MRILHVITSLYTGGAEHLMVDLLPQLNKGGDVAELLLFDGTVTPFYKELASRKIKIHSLDKGGNVYNPMNIFKLVSFIGQYDIIHTHNTACQLFAPMAKLLSLTRKPLVTTEHSANNRRRGKWWLKPLDRWMYNRYRAVICIADKTQANLENYIGKKENILTIYNGVDTRRFICPIKDISQQQQFVITMVASLSAAKDQDTLIRAMSHLPENYTLQLVGDGERRPILEQLIADLNLQDRVKMLGIRTDIPQILGNSDIVALSSHWEGLSLSSIEGMASGRPFIASDVDGLREIVDGSGLLFPEGDDRQTAALIHNLCTNPSEYRSVAERCQAKAKEYDISKMARSYLELYRSISGIN